MAPTCPAAGLLMYFLLVVVPMAFAWGPLSHYAMTCRALSASSVDDCATNSSLADLIVGTDLPDAFYFGEFVTGSSCTQARGLHNIVYAGYQFKYAQLEDTAGNSPFNACQYALGFGAHVAADYAGFYPGGYLGNGHSPNGATWRNWISLWPFMTVVDAYVARNWTMSLPHLPTSPLSSAGAAFIADATAYSGKQGQQFPVLSPSEVLNCTTTWSETVNRNVDVAGNYLASTIDHDLVFYDLYGAATTQEAIDHLNMATDCGVALASAWATHIQASGSTPESAAAATLALLKSLVAAGKCNPPTL